MSEREQGGRGAGRPPGRPLSLPRAQAHTARPHATPGARSCTVGIPPQSRDPGLGGHSHAAPSLSFFSHLRQSARSGRTPCARPCTASRASPPVRQADCRRLRREGGGGEEECERGCACGRRRGESAGGGGGPIGAARRLSLNSLPPSPSTLTNHAAKPGLRGGRGLARIGLVRGDAHVVPVRQHDVLHVKVAKRKTAGLARE